MTKTSRTANIFLQDWQVSIDIPQNCKPTIIIYHHLSYAIYIYILYILYIYIYTYAIYYIHIFNGSSFIIFTRWTKIRDIRDLWLGAVSENGIPTLKGRHEGDVDHQSAGDFVTKGGGASAADSAVELFERIGSMMAFIWWGLYMGFMWDLHMGLIWDYS